MASPAAAQSDGDSLREEIALQQAIHASLGDSEEDLIAKDKISADLAKLEARLKKMERYLPLPHWEQPEYYQSQQSSDQRPESSTNSYYSTNSPTTDNQYLMPPSNSNSHVLPVLPNRKRSAAFEDESSQQFNKSRKATPIPRPSPRAGSVDSVDSNDSTDSLLKGWLDIDWDEEAEKSKKIMKDLERKKLQEEEDAQFARELQERWEKEQVSMPAPKQSTSLSNATQSFMRPDGSYQKPKPEPAFVPIKHDLSSRSGPSGALTPMSDDSSGLEEISSSDWTNKFGSVSGQASNASISGYGQRNMPGTFPNGTYNAYASAPGSTVYGGTSYQPYNSSTSALGNYGTSLVNQPYQYNQLTGGFNMPGSSSLPFDVDNLPMSSFSQINNGWHEPEQTQEEIRDLLKHIRPDEELTEEQLREVQPEGLKIDLMPHQRKGFAWMKLMEEGTNKGGILADDMGLGKTVQALSLILARPPEEGKHRPTLIVAPVALMQQWEREIQKFIKRSHRLSVLILHQENRNKPWNFIKEHDVVLTTYGTLASELKRKIVWDKHLELVPDARPKPSQMLPLMGRSSYFHRIVLDEAQNIKNKNTKAAAAAYHLQADYRWCLSGTPMQNNVDEIYSLIKFCRIRPYHDYDKFAKDISRPLKRVTSYGKDQAMERLQALLRAVLLRRTKKSEIDGQPIIQLPEKHTVEERAIFGKDELDFYKALEQQSQIQFNKFLKKGSIGRHYSHALVLLLRLRQCCCSAQLVTNAPDFMSSGAVEDVDYIENAKSLPDDVVRRLGEADAFECPVCMDAVENPIIFNPCGHSLCAECLTAMTEKAMTDASGKLSCPHCRAEININLVTNHESYLRVHHPEREGVKPLDESDDEADEEAEETDSDSDSSDENEDGSDDGADLKDFIVPDDEDVEYDTDAGESDKKMKNNPFKHLKPEKQDEEEESLKPEQKSKAKIKDKGKSKKVSKDKSKGKAKSKTKKGRTTLADLRREGLKSQSAKKKYLKKLAKGWLPSAKIEKTVELLQQIKDKGEGEKTIIFSAFTTFLDLIEVPLSRDEELCNYVRYDGSMKTQDRTASVVRFTDDPNCTVILVSLKAGNAGLNLTAANHVIILDPFWNPFVEYQAADRCYRIGQTREVFIHRILIGDERDEGAAQDPGKDFTVEDRILKLQEKKKLFVETALDEKAASNFGRLSTRDLGYLFGVNSME